MSKGFTIFGYVASLITVAAVDVCLAFLALVSPITDGDPRKPFMILSALTIWVGLILIFLLIRLVSFVRAKNV